MVPLLLLASVCVAANPAVDFDTEVIPILTKAGCNAAACHGAAAGRGGLKLSLFGGDPAWDHAEIVHQLEGRRVNMVRPDESLILAKPTEQIAHEGGYRLEYDGADAALLLRWITEGAGRGTSRRCIRVDVTPPLATVPVGARLNITVRAHFDDGTSADVSRWAVYQSTDDGAVTVSPDGQLSIQRRGRHAIIVSYLSHVQSIQVTVPLSDTPVDLANAPRQNWIDDEIFETLSALRLPPSAAASDAQLLRRLRLDLTGRLPTTEEARRYLGNPDSRKFDQLVDELLGSDAFVEFWTFQLATLLRVQSQPNETDGARAFHAWLRRQLQGDVPWSDVTSAMLMAQGDTHEVGPANFYRVARGPREQAEYVTEALLGVRLRCANCHNHPLDRWTQDDYHGLAAIFARVEQGRDVRIKTRGEVIHPATGDAARPRIPGDRFLDTDEDGRRALTQWMVHPDNPLFAKAMVNRIWKALMGRGLIEPTDDLRATNPATHPELLNRLAADFAEHGFRLHHTIRLIITSAAYARGSETVPANQYDDRFYSHAIVKPLAAEVLADAIADVTGKANVYGGQPIGTRAISLYDPRTESPTLDILGRCSREASCETASVGGGGLSAKLHMINGPLLNEKIAAPDGRLHRLLRAGATTGEILEEFYLAALGRLPGNDETAYWAGEIGNEATLRTDKLEDFLWSLLNGRDFTTNQ